MTIKTKEEILYHLKNKCLSSMKNKDENEYSNIEDLGAVRNFTLRQEEIFKKEWLMVLSTNPISDMKINWIIECKNILMTVKQLEI